MSAPEIAEIPPGLQKAQKADPQGMALRSPPRPVVRLNRRVLVILAGLLATLVLGATLRAKGGPLVFSAITGGSQTQHWRGGGVGRSLISLLFLFTFKSGIRGVNA